MMEDEHENTIRMRMVGLPDAKLDQMSRDDSLRQVERDIARTIMYERDRIRLLGDPVNAVSVAALEAREEAKRRAMLEQQAAEREAARRREDTAQPVDIEMTRTENEQAARMFADMLQAAVDPNLVHVMRTEAIAGNKVRDGWTVNYHDTEAEVGLVAVWWGKGHFKAYIEMVGHIGRTAEAAALLGKVFTK
jgi:hypothetical protein